MIDDNERKAEAPPDLPAPLSEDDRYFLLLTRAVRVCAQYQPKFGRGGQAGVTLDEFQQMYGADPFYHWLGLDSPLMYAAHKAAGGMTSIYRQIGIGCQGIFGRLLRDYLGLSDAEATWEYQDMMLHVGELFRVVRSGGHISYVVGNSKFYDVLLPVETIFACLFEAAGFVQSDIRVIRKRTSKKELFEFVVSARKP